MLSKTIYISFLVVTLLLSGNACKAQTLGWQLYHGQGLNNQDGYKVSLEPWSAPQTLRITTNSGEVLYSDNYGLTWHLLGGLINYTIHDIEELEDYDYIRGRQIHKCSPGYSNSKLPGNNGLLNAASDSIWAVGNGGAILFSSNGGTNWVQQTSGITGDIYSVNFLDNDYGWAADDQGHIVHTTNAGSNWVLQSSLGLTTFKVFFSDLQNGWVTGFGSFVKYTSNSGANWVDRTPPNVDPIGYIWSMQFIDQNTGWMAGQNYGSYSLFRTTNGGVHWDSCTISPAPSIIWGLSFVNASTGYACGPSTIFKTTNGGINWTSQTLPSGAPILYDIQFVNPDTGYAVGQNATIMYTTSGGEPIGIRTISTNVPKTFVLGQNYPNPFNPTTKIRFDITPPLIRPQSGGDAEGVRLIIYDALGREVSTLVNERLNPGTYEVSWDAGSFPSGAYFYRLSAGDYVQTRKMVLLK